MTAPQARPDIRELAGYHSPQLDVDIRLNTNEAAVAPPDAFIAELAAQTTVIDWNRYPDRTASALRAAIAEFHSRTTATPLSPEWVFAANGSNEVLQTLLLTYGGQGRTVGIFEPTYAMYSQIARATGTAVATEQRNSEHQVTTAAIDRLVERAAPDVLVLCSPNNPTGTAEQPEVIEHALGVASGLVVVDEAYGQFSDWSAVDLLDTPAGRERLMVVRTFSKTWAMAGLRLGYCLAPPEVVAEFEKVVLPYHLDSHKQLAGTLALRHVDEMNQRVAGVVAERQRVAQGLSDLGLTVYPSSANFILFNTASAGIGGNALWGALVNRSVLVRDCSGWEGLADCLRVTIGTPAENDALLAATADALSDTAAGGNGRSVRQA